MTNADDQPTTPPAPPAPPAQPAAPSGTSPYSPKAQADDDATTDSGAPTPPASGEPAPPAFPAASGVPTAPPAYAPAPPPPYSAGQPAGQPAPGQPAAGQAYVAGQPYVAGEPVPPRGLALASMITGIAGLVLAFAGVGFLPAVAAVVLGHIAQRKQPYARPFWLTGLITGYVGVAIGLITVAFWIIVIIAGIASSNSYNGEFS